MERRYISCDCLRVCIHRDLLIKIASDPLYFMPNNDVQDVLGMNYGMYMAVYVLFLMLFMTSFYLVTYLYNRKRLKQKDTF